MKLKKFVKEGYHKQRLILFILAGLITIPAGLISQTLPATHPSGYDQVLNNISPGEINIVDALMVPVICRAHYGILVLIFFMQE